MSADDPAESGGPPSPEPWPLSAMATKILIDGRVRPTELLPLAYKELVILGAVQLAPAPRGRFSRPRTHLTLVHGASVGAPELTDLLAALERHAANGGTVDKVVQTIGAKDYRLPKRIADRAARDVVRNGFATSDERRFLGITYRRRLRATPSGEQLRADLARRIASASAGTPADLSPALLLLLRPAQRGEIDRALGGSSEALPAFSIDFSQLDALHCFDTACHDGGAHSGHDGGGAHH